MGPAQTLQLIQLRESYEKNRPVVTREAAAELALEIRKLERSATETVRTIAGERGLDVILEKSNPGVFFHATRVDITEAVIARVDARPPEARGTPAPAK